jgi:hypothetical protein
MGKIERIQVPPEDGQRPARLVRDRNTLQGAAPNHGRAGRGTEGAAPLAPLCMSRGKSGFRADRLPNRPWRSKYVSAHSVEVCLALLTIPGGAAARTGAIDGPIRRAIVAPGDGSVNCDLSQSRPDISVLSDVRHVDATIADYSEHHRRPGEPSLRLQEMRERDHSDSTLRQVTRTWPETCHARPFTAARLSRECRHGP